jgi:hypothetical protein
MALLEKSASVELSRRTQPFYAKKQSYNLGQQVQIEVDTQREFIDFSNSRLMFKLGFYVQNNGTPRTARPKKWVAGATVKNLRVKTLSGQMIGHEIREYRAWDRMNKDLKARTNDEQGYDLIMEGGDGLLLGLDGAAGPQQYSFEYAHSFTSHILSLKDYYPAHFHQGLMIEYDLPAAVSELFLQEDAADITDAGNERVTIEDVKFVCDLVQLKPEIENEMVRLMEEQKLFVDYMEVLTQENSLSNSAGLQAYDVVGIDGRVKSAFSYTTRATTSTGLGQDNGEITAASNEFLGNAAVHGLASYRYKLGSRYLNYESIGSSIVFQQNVGAAVIANPNCAEQLYELQKALDIHSKGGDGMKMGNKIPSEYVTEKFVVGVKVDKAMKDVDEVISSQVDKDRNNMRIELNFAAAPGTGATAYTHVYLDKRLQLLPGSIVRSVRS